MLLQSHDLATQEIYDKLQEVCVDLYSVKTERFTIKLEDLEKAASCMGIFGAEPTTSGDPTIRQQRISQTQNIKFNSRRK